MTSCALCLGIVSSSLVSATESEDIIPIDLEPNHHLVLSAPAIRVFDVSFLPGELSRYHRHSADSVLICLEGGNVTNEEPGKLVVPRPPINSGLIYYKPYADAPFVHRIRNIGDTKFRILDIEFLAAKRSNSLPELPQAYQVVLENDRTRVSKLSLKPGQSLAPQLTTTHLIVATHGDKYSLQQDGAEAISYTVTPGHLNLRQTTAHYVITNSGTEELKLVTIEAK